MRRTRLIVKKEREFIGHRLRAFRYKYKYPITPIGWDNYGMQKEQTINT